MNNIILPYKKITAAAPGRNNPAAYLADCQRLGKITGSGDSALIEFTPDVFQHLRQKYNKASTTPGLGDRAHAFLGPIGKAVRWPCMKGDGTTDLKPGSPCSKARTLLNQISPGTPAPSSVPAPPMVQRPAQIAPIKGTPNPNDARNWRPPGLPAHPRTKPQSAIKS